MAFIQPMHHNKCNFTYLLVGHLLVGDVSLQVRVWCHWHTRFLPITRTLIRFKIIRWSSHIVWKKKRKPNTVPSHTTRLVLGLQTANERRRYNVTLAGRKTRIIPDTTWHFTAYFRENSNPMENVPLSWYVVASATAMKRSVDDDSSDEESRPNAKKMSAASSPASMRPDTAVSKEREGRDLPRISTFPSAPKSGEQRANGRCLSPIRPPSFNSGGPQGEVLTTIINPLHHQNPSTKKVMWKQQLLQNHKYGSQLHNPVEL